MNNTTTTEADAISPVHELSELRSRLSVALSLRYPSLKPYQLTNCVNKYVDVMLRELVTAFTLYNKSIAADGEIQIGMENAKIQAGRIDIDKKTQWIVPMMQADTSTKLLHITFKGNVGKNSRAVYNMQYKGLIMEELKSLLIELNPKTLKSIEDKANVRIPVNPESLLSFLIQSRRTLSTLHTNDEYAETITRNIRLGTQLMDMIQEEDGKFFVNEYWEEADAGRIYGHGLSLQRLPAEVRHAVLGECHKYDFKASSYALMTGLALSIDPTIKHAALTDYIKYRSAIRKRIAADVGISEKWMKEVFTSLGFGASLKDNPYSSIREKIGKEKFLRLVANTEFATIKEQLDTVRKVISKEFSEDEFEFAGRVYNSLDPVTKIKRSKNQKLAWIYQAMETYALNMFTEKCNIDIVLTTHDCVYTIQKLPNSFLADMQYCYSQAFPLLTFEHEAIYPIHATEDHGKKTNLITSLINQHKQDIILQEEIARDYTSAHIDTVATKKKQIQTPWGLVDADLYEPHITNDQYFSDTYYNTKTA